MGAAPAPPPLGVPPKKALKLRGKGIRTGGNSGWGLCRGF